jgi:hypothetical protein
MRKYWLILLIGLIVLAGTTATIFLTTKLQKQATKNSVATPTPISPENWIKNMLLKYPHLTGSFWGVEPTRSKQEIWIIGRRMKPTETTTRYFYLENDYVTIIAKLSSNPVYTSQTGDDFNKNTDLINIPATDIVVGDHVGIRTTYSENFPLILEVRKLIRDTQN